MRSRSLTAWAAVLGLGLATGTALAASAVDGYNVAVDETGNLRVPDVDYRATWALLGSWVGTGGEKVDGKEGAAYLHVVYTQPGVIEQYRDTGKFPDGAVLVKELLKAKTNTMTTGVVSHATELEGWFVMVKDAKGRFTDNKLWGDGWGWAQFDVDSPTRTKTSDYKTECLGCHVPAKDTDWIYTYGYAALSGPAVKP